MWLEQHSSCLPTSSSSSLSLCLLPCYSLPIFSSPHSYSFLISTISVFISTISTAQQLFPNPFLSLSLSTDMESHSKSWTCMRVCVSSETCRANPHLYSTGQAELDVLKRTNSLYKGSIGAWAPVYACQTPSTTSVSHSIWIKGKYIYSACKGYTHKATF